MTAGINTRLHPNALEMLAAAARIVKPFERMSPSEFAARFRQLRPGTTEQPGPWRNEYFPYLVDIMNVIEEAVRTGRKGVVLMKSAQGGGSEGMINGLAWLKKYMPGPILYLISKDDLAFEFGRNRFGHLVDTCAPIAENALRGKRHNESVQIKRFTDGDISIQGGRSVFNLQSTPYKYVFIDEVDSLIEEHELEGDPIKLAEQRTASYPGPTLIVAFAHPTTRERGAGRLYYEQSDQRRGYVDCAHCGHSFALQWEHVKASPGPGMTQAQAELDARCYHYFAPCCGAEISDGQRWSMCRRVTQRSTLTPEAAAGKTWIGVHFSQLYMPNKTLQALAQDYIECAGDEARKKVFVNKTLGDVYDASVKDVTRESWRRLQVIPRGENDTECYVRGQVPPGVRFLTAGQDSRSTELHYAIWGWGWMTDEAGRPIFCGWLIDYDVIKRQYSLTLNAAELSVFDQLIYQRAFISTEGLQPHFVQQGYHDSGWWPVAAYEYCRGQPFRAIPSKGASDDAESSGPLIRWGASPVYRINGLEVRDPRLKPAMLNTYQLKLQFYGLVESRFKRVRKAGLPAEECPQLFLPHNVGEDFIAQVSSEYLGVEKRKKKWKHKGPNHWADCSIYAYAAAQNLSAFDAQQLNFDNPESPSGTETPANESSYAPAESGGGSSADPLMM